MGRDDKIDQENMKSGETWASKVLKGTKDENRGQAGPAADVVSTSISSPPPATNGVSPAPKDGASHLPLDTNGADAAPKKEGDVPSPPPAAAAPSPPVKPLDERTVLANPYAPAKLRQINETRVTLTLLAGRPPNLDQKLWEIGNALVPYTPRCICGEKHKARIKVMLPEHGEPDFRVALKPRASIAGKFLPRVEAIDSLTDYVNTFRALLKEERTALLHLYELYSQYDHHISFQDPPLPLVRKAKLENRPVFVAASMAIPGIADVRPSLQSNDHVLVRPGRMLAIRNQYGNYDSHCVEIQSRVHQVRRGTKPGEADTVMITWLDLAMQHMLMEANRTGAKYNVRFVPSATLHERMMRALQWLHTLPSKFVREMLFPTKIPAMPKMPHRSMLNRKSNNNDLNEEQQFFVDMMVHRTRHPSLDTVRPPLCLTGPAGTGKTKAMLEAIVRVLEEDVEYRILVCTPSHTAADVITMRLSSLLPHPGTMFRLYDTDRPVATVPAGVIRYTRQLGETGTFTMPTEKELLKFRVVVCTCSDAFLLYQVGLTNQDLVTRRRCFNYYLTRTLTQCNMSLSGSISGLKTPHFSHLFIDEAAQAKEPESLIPLSVVVDPRLGTRKVEIALVGDPRQLSPNVYSDHAADAGLSQSFLERLLLRSVNCLQGNNDMLTPNLDTMDELISYSFQEQLSVVLTMNYRGHPSFLMMPSVLFYFDKLQSAKSIDSSRKWCPMLRQLEEASGAAFFLTQHRSLSWPIHFRGVVGKDASVTIESIAGSNSWSNREEADAVVDIVSVLLKNEELSTQSIGVMAPFRGQVVLLRQLLREKKMGTINVGTIEDYQAVERDVIVLSLTRSTLGFVSHDLKRRMGLFNQPKRTNVALTRAENLLIVVGNPNIMWKDPIWRQWLGFCFRNGLWYGEGCDMALKNGAADGTVSLSSTLERVCRLY